MLFRSLTLLDGRHLLDLHRELTGHGAQHQQVLVVDGNGITGCFRRLKCGSGEEVREGGDPGVET